jgi:hypothetical protein
MPYRLERGGKGRRKNGLEFCHVVPFCNTDVTLAVSQHAIQRLFLPISLRKIPAFCHPFRRFFSIFHEKNLHPDRPSQEFRKSNGQKKNNV